MPRRLARALTDWGHPCVHTRDLPLGNRTGDSSLIQLADREGRVVVTKDRDFVVSFLIRGAPQKLLLVTTGNVTNDDLIATFQRNVSQIERLFDTARFIEMDRTRLIVHA